MIFCYIVIGLFLMWGSMRDQGLHEGVDSLKCLPRPDLYLSISIEIHRSPHFGGRRIKLMIPLNSPDIK